MKKYAVVKLWDDMTSNMCGEEEASESCSMLNSWS